MKVAVNFLIVLFLLSAPATLPAQQVDSHSGMPGRAEGDTLALTIDQSIEIALENNPTMRVAVEKVNEAKSQVGEAGTAFLPQLEGQAGYTRLDMAPFFPTSKFMMFGGGTPPPGTPKKITIGLPDNFSASLTLSQPIFTGGKLKNSFEISKLARATAQSELTRTHKELIYQVKAAYWNLVRARQYEKVAAESLEQLRAHLNDVENMYNVGIAAKNDLLKSKVYYSKAKLGLMSARHGVKLARRNLCNTLGISIDKEIICTSNLEAIDTTEIDLDSAIETGLKKSPELKTMDYQKMMAAKQVEIARSGYIPDIFFSANLEYKYPDREYNKDFYTTWTVGFYAQMNLFDWGKAAYQGEEAKSRLKQVEVSRKGLKDGLILNITRAYLSVVEARNEIDAAKEALDQAEENFRVTDEKFKEGLVTNAELLDAQVMLTGAKTDFSNAFINYRMARADLARSMGLDQTR
ncbi:MAG: hypothetical protein B6D63_07365 [Candidatus Latescibacteria bacterium 4484_7]|nr:MAG: hypothetical protein B6D63_07365 [Candidatus Latescibacteria bacterium 4484_7]RKZ08955.1 MAG: hypothetical protein DRQ05_00575 [bacterium]